MQACLTPNENAGGFFLATSMQGAYSAGLGFVFLSHNGRIFGRIVYKGGRLLIRFTSCCPYDAGPGTFSLHLALRFLPALKTIRFRTSDQIIISTWLRQKLVKLSLHCVKRGISQSRNDISSWSWGITGTFHFTTFSSHTPSRWIRGCSRCYFWSVGARSGPISAGYNQYQR